MKNLRKLRKAAGFTLEGVADRLGIAYTTVSSWERGKTFPSPENFDRLANLYNVRVSAIFLEEDFVSQPTPQEALAVLQNAVVSKQQESDLDIIKEAGVEWQYGIVMDEARKIVAQKRAEQKKKKSS